MPRLQAKSFAAPTRCAFPRFVSRPSVSTRLPDRAIARSSPAGAGRPTSGPLVGTTTCPIRHLGYVLSGGMHVEMDDGQTLEIGPDTVFEIPPGHDKWVVGDEPWVTSTGAPAPGLDAALRRRRRSDPRHRDVHGHRRLDRDARRGRRCRLAGPPRRPQRAARRAESTCSAVGGQDDRRRLPRRVRQPDAGAACPPPFGRQARMDSRSGSGSTPARSSWSARTSAGIAVHSPPGCCRGRPRRDPRVVDHGDLLDGSGIWSRGRRRARAQGPDRRPPGVPARGRVRRDADRGLTRDPDAVRHPGRGGPGRRDRDWALICIERSSSPGAASSTPGTRRGSSDSCSGVARSTRSSRPG